jgi:hypothetical protein
MSKKWVTALKFIHKANTDHYRRLLHTELTDSERAFVERRLGEERFALQQLTKNAARTRTSIDAA